MPSAPPAVARADTALSMAEQFQHLVAGYLTDKPLDTGFVALDAALDGGLYPGVYLLCARPGEGKTSFALQMADHIARQGHELCWISLDMTAREILVKSLSRLTLELDTTENKDQACTSRQVMAQLGQPDQPLVLERAVQAYQAYASRIRFIEQLQPLVLSDLILRLESLAAGGSRPVVVLDSLQYILPQTEGLNDVQQQDQSVRTLMQFSRRHHLPVLALSGVIRDSYASDVIVSLQMEPAEGTLSSPHQIRLEILKNRQGPAGQRQPYVFCAAYNAFAQR
ncbi:MAG: AAA family ATPase [Clostridiaceae bacterium]|nr:AAA family ATPase [Clostridiaceae bacterium]